MPLRVKIGGVWTEVAAAYARSTGWLASTVYGRRAGAWGEAFAPGGGTPTITDPGDIPNLTGWYDFDDTGLLTLAGSDVLAVQAKVGADLINAVTAGGPYVQHGVAMNARQGVSVANQRGIIADIAPLVPVRTFFAVMRAVTGYDVNNRYAIEFDGNGVGNLAYRQTLIMHSNVTGRYATVNGVLTDFNSAVIPSDVVVVEGVFDNGTPVNFRAIGQRVSNRIMAADIGELVFYERVLTTPERVAVRQWLADRWAITL